MPECKVCNEDKHTDDFYIYSKRVCKKCRSVQTRQRYQNITNGFERRNKKLTDIPLETRAKIIQDLEDGIPRTRLAEKYGLSYSTLTYWIRFGILLPKHVES